MNQFHPQLPITTKLDLYGYNKSIEKLSKLCEKGLKFGDSKLKIRVLERIEENPKKSNSIPKQTYRRHVHRRRQRRRK